MSLSVCDNFGVLIIDDNDYSLEILTLFFSRFSKNILKAKSAKQGFELYRQHRPDFIISNMIAPIISEEIKAIDESAFIVAIINANDKKNLAEILYLSADKYLLAPINLVRLEKILIHFLEHFVVKREYEKNEKLLIEYKKALDSSAIFTITDTNGIIKYVNDEFVHKTGYTKEEAVGHSHDIIKHPDTPKRVFMSLWKCIKNKHIWKNTIENKTKNGDSFISNLTVIPVLDTNDEIAEYIAISYDITGIREMNEQTLQAVFNADESLIVVTDDSFEIKMINKAMLKALNLTSMHEFYQENRAIYDNFLKRDGCLSKDDLQGSTRMQKYKKLKKLLTDSNKNQLKVAMLTKGEHDRYYALRASTITDKLIKNKTYNIFNFMDITELEHMRRQQIDTAKLNSIGMLAAGITHEINTPLTYIKGNLELLQMDIQDSCYCEPRDDFLASCDAMEDGIRRIASIVESMREIAGNVNHEKTQINVYTTLIYALRMIYNKAKQICNIKINGKLFDIKLDRNDEKIMMMAVAQRLEQVWIIIVNNALDEYLKSKLPFEERLINVEVSKKLDTISVSIKDNAGGIKESMLSHVFEVFQSSKPQSGMGIGLNIAKSIVENHNGVITAKNKNGGAVFEVVFKEGKGL